MPKIHSTRHKLYIISHEFFQAALVAYMILALAETLRPGSVDNFFNMYILLSVVLATGLLSVLLEQKGFRYRLRCH